MNVTRENFNASLSVITKAIQEADFISFDGEFTGLTNKTCILSLFDSPEERYEKLCYNTDGFILLQFGLATFFWKEDLDKYEVKAFNFYIFPHSSPCFNSPDRIFSCQSSSLEFLRNQDFDFNLVFKKGIPYLKQNEESVLRTALQEKQAQREVVKKNENIHLLQSPNDEKTKHFLENICESIQKFLDETDQTELFLEPCNSYLRKVLYEVLPSKFPNRISVDLHINENNQQRQIVVTRGNDELIKKEKRERLKVQEEAHFEDAVGFSKIIKLLSESEKILIGHNMLLDLLFTINQFVTPLPSTLAEFKTILSSAFPKLVDTKLMASLLPFKDLIASTTLNDLYKALQSKPFKPPSVEVPLQYMLDESLHKVKLHEAAYDAYITGVSFLNMLHYLPLMQKSDNSNISTPPVDLVTPFVNKVFLLKSFDIPYINLAGPDLTPDRDHVFYVTFPSKWKATDLRQLFSSFGHIVISWIGDTECFIGLHDKTQAKNVKTMLQQDIPKSCSYAIMSYAEYLSSKSLSSQLYQSSSKILRQTPEKFSYVASPIVQMQQASPITPITMTSPGQSSNRKRTIQSKDSSASSTTSKDSCHPNSKKQKLQINKEKSFNDADSNVKGSAAEETSHTSSKATQLFDVPNEW